MFRRRFSPTVTLSSSTLVSLLHANNKVSFQSSTLHQQLVQSIYFCSASSQQQQQQVDAPQVLSKHEIPTSSSSSSSSPLLSATRSSVLTLAQMELNLRRQLGPQAQLLVREQFTAAGRRRRRRQMMAMKSKQNAVGGGGGGGGVASGTSVKPRRLDIDDVAAASATTKATATAAAATNASTPELREDSLSSSSQKNQLEDDQNDQEPLSVFRSSVTFRQCGFSVTLCTAESSKSADEALRLAYNGAVATDISFFNPTLRPQDAAVFDRVRFLALGLGKMIRFSVGGGGDDLLLPTATKEKTNSSSSSSSNNKTKTKTNISSNYPDDQVRHNDKVEGGAVTLVQQEGNGDVEGQHEELDEEQQQQQQHDDNDADDDAPIFTCTTLMKDDFDVAGRAKDFALVTTIGRSAQEAFNRAVVATRDRLTKETEEGTHALEDVRELQLFLDHNVPPSPDHLGSDGSDHHGPLINNSNKGGGGKLLHPELFVTTGSNKGNRNNNNNNNNNNNSNFNSPSSSVTDQSPSASKNYTARITVTDSSGNSYYVKSGDFNKTALAAYRSCVNQIYKKESFLQGLESHSSCSVASSSASPSSANQQNQHHHHHQQIQIVKPAQKSFFAQIQWQVEHLTWHSGLARSLDWEYHYRSTVRSSFSAAAGGGSGGGGTGKRGAPSGGCSTSDNSNSSSNSGNNAPTYLHSTLHIGPVELAFADGVGRYRVMLNCYCNALERLLINAPKRFTQYLPIPSVPALYALYMEVDRFQPTDALKGAIKGLNPQTVLGAILNVHLGSYFQMPIERRESMTLTRLQREKNHHQGNNNNNNDMASEDVVYVVATLPNQETTLTLSDASTIKPGTKTLVLGRTTASRLACTYALRDNFPLVYNQVKDRPDFKQGGVERENERKLQKLRSLPRETRVGQYDSLLTMLREFGSEDHGWADVDVECSLRSVGLWVATVYVRVKKDNTTRDIRISRPTATKGECRKRVILETAFTYYPQETQLYLSKVAKKEEYSKDDLAAVMGNQIASSIKPYDPVSSGSVVDQMLAILEERARMQLQQQTQTQTQTQAHQAPHNDGGGSTASNAKIDDKNDTTLPSPIKISTNNSTSTKNKYAMIEDLVGDEDILRVSCELVTEHPFPRSTLTTRRTAMNQANNSSSKFSFFDSEQKDVRYAINIISSPALLGGSSGGGGLHHQSDTSASDHHGEDGDGGEYNLHSSSSSSSSLFGVSTTTAAVPDEKLILRAVSLPGTPLLQAVRDTITSATVKLQLDAERIRLLIASFEEFKVPQIFRPQDLAEWLLKANFGLENVKVEVNYTQQMWVGALYIRFPVQECYWPGNDYQRQQLKKNRHHLRLASSSSNSSSSSNNSNGRGKERFFLHYQLQQAKLQAAAAAAAAAAAVAAGSAGGQQQSYTYVKNSAIHQQMLLQLRKQQNQNGHSSSSISSSSSVVKVYEWVEIARSIATGKRDAIKLCYIKAALTNCYAHLQYMAKKSMEQQADAEEVLSCDTEQHHGLLTTEQVAHFLKLSPSPLSVLRAALRRDKLKLLISVDRCATPAAASASLMPLPTASAVAACDIRESSSSVLSSSSSLSATTTATATATTMGSKSEPLRPLFSKRFTSLFGIEGKDRGNDLGVATTTAQPSTTFSSSPTQGEVAESYFECTLFTVPLHQTNQQLQRQRYDTHCGGGVVDVDDDDGEGEGAENSSIRIIARNQSATAAGALEDSVYKALDDLLGDDDLKYWLSRWKLEMLDAETASMEKLAVEMEE